MELKQKRRRSAWRRRCSWQVGLASTLVLDGSKSNTGLPTRLLELLGVYRRNHSVESICASAVSDFV